MDLRIGEKVEAVESTCPRLNLSHGSERDQKAKTDAAGRAETRVLYYERGREKWVVSKAMQGEGGGWLEGKGGAETQARSAQTARRTRRRNKRGKQAHARARVRRFGATSTGISRLGCAAAAKREGKEEARRCTRQATRECFDAHKERTERRRNWCNRQQTSIRVVTGESKWKQWQGGNGVRCAHKRNTFRR
eukprot:6207755-Pleurochrysis_carterae.AAC.1